MHFPSYLKKPRGSTAMCLYRQGWRPVIHLKWLNSHIDAPHFCLFTISSVLSTIKTGDFAFRIDLEETYFHILIHKDRHSKVPALRLYEQDVSVQDTPLVSTQLLRCSLTWVTSIVRESQCFHTSTFGWYITGLRLTSQLPGHSAARFAGL